MGKVKARTKMNKKALRTISESAVEALEKTLQGSRDSILGDIMTAEVVPKQTGELERSAFVDESQAKKGQVSVVYDTPYARRLYWHPEYNFRRDKNRNAQGMWLEEWAQGGKENIVKRVFTKIWKKLTGGIIK
ncbi:hypothetical protein DFQ01_12184 [Paenibacillus cellulosilyticus]|uniref:Minor capsid protein n=1 Tax=Paenibacillus cellulosilyticus TaxID=375489 RepID=A0A2V2YNP9_9BACL|nr:hypothetical protein [Paenibacillus cellulosilyticus]PWV97440.1 hypothetical protein DFQ01_12184 [Paenibacillus cellulosilyticus]QKS48521.1 hypothetical protein HUB94_30265 [Paenibacillus cellulosilyticus]